VSKEVIILCRYAYKYVNNTRSDCIKYKKNPENLETSCGQENPIFLLIEKFLELKLLCHDSLKVDDNYMLLVRKSIHAQVRNPIFHFPGKWWPAAGGDIAGTGSVHFWIATINI
jgi:hypothetical protein